VTQILKIPQNGADQAGRPPYRLPFGLLNELHHPRDMFCDLGPNWYASVMGTGIVAIAGASLSAHVPGLHGFATAMWVLAAAALIALTAAWTVHWIRYPDQARGHADNPVMAQFWGAPPMALMTVGAGNADPGPGMARSRCDGRRGLGAVAGRDRARASHHVLDPVPDDDAALHQRRRGVRRLADAGRPADGLGRHRLRAG
jgi:Voltage-dependent anion channel